MPNGTILMTQTLPTIIGAGVVSRTTETLFSKSTGKRVKKPRGYHVSKQGWHNRKDALNAAKKLRKNMGCKARVAYDGKYYRVLWK